MNKSKPCLLFLYPVIDATGCGFVSPEQADRAGEVGIQHVSCFISHHQVQAQDPEWHRDVLRRTEWGGSLRDRKGAGLLPVSIINLCCDFLLKLHQVILRQRSRHYLRTELDEAVGHLLDAPEQGCLVCLPQLKINTNMSQRGVTQVCRTVGSSPQMLR